MGNEDIIKKKIESIEEIRLSNLDSWSSSLCTGRFSLETDGTKWEDPDFDEIVLKPIKIGKDTYFKVVEFIGKV